MTAERNMTAKAPALELKLNRRGEAAPVGVVGAGAVTLGAVEEGGDVTVVPKPGVVATGVVASGVVPVAPVDPDTEEPEAVEEAKLLEEAAAIEKSPLVAKTWVMLEMFTASNVYPSPTGTMGNSMVIVPEVGTTLLAMAKEL
jgi:hypothetical protein